MTMDDEALIREAVDALARYTQPIEVVLTPTSAFDLCALLQLALRHPGVKGRSRVAALEFIAHLREYFDDTPAILEMIRRGDDPSYDKQVGTTTRSGER
jgi:hypothetical protein